MSDLLTAESLTFAIISVLFGLWYREIVEISELEMDEATTYINPSFSDIKACFLKITFIGISFFLLVVVFLPEAIIIIGRSINLIFSNGTHVYDTVSAAYLLILILNITLTIYSLFYWEKIRKFFVFERKKIKKK